MNASLLVGGFMGTLLGFILGVVWALWRRSLQPCEHVTLTSYAPPPLPLEPLQTDDGHWSQSQWDEP